MCTVLYIGSMLVGRLFRIQHRCLTYTSISSLGRQTTDGRSYILPLSSVASQTLISQTAEVGSWEGRKNRLRHFIQPSRKFCSGQKVRNSASVFDPSHLCVIPVSKRSNVQNCIISFCVLSKVGLVWYTHI